MYKKCYFILFFVVFVVSCQKNENNTILQNDCIKRSLGPNIVGENIEFAYAIALPSNVGKIISVGVEASIQGNPDTWLENKSYYTDLRGGNDIGIQIGNPSVNSGNITEMIFTKDTCAATLRYYYVISEEARGKEVSFVFSAKGSNGEEVTYNMGPYVIASMDMKLDMAVSNDNLCYISIEDMAVYNAGDATTKADKIDLVYLYRNIPGISFEHAFVSPGANVEYLPEVVLPSSVSRTSKIRRAWGLQDRQLARIQHGIYIDDLDFVELDMTEMPDYSINMKAESGIWVETQDGKYRAYIYVNSINNSGKSAVISIKRYTM
jgi:hypothetical protein